MSKSMFDEIKKIASNGDVTPYKKCENVEKLAILFINSYEGTKLSLGEDPINDGFLFKKNIEELGYKCFIYYDINSSMFLTIFKSVLQNEFKHLVIYFSGHGTYYRDTNHDEEDGRDEALVFRDKSILDDELGYILEKYNKTKKLTLIPDCCHSGTIFDVPKDAKNILTISASYDSETAKQTFIDHKGNGIFTYYFWKYFPSCGNSSKKLMGLINSKIKAFKQHCNSNLDDEEIFVIDEK